MRVLMIGWELPPFNSGGLGEACYRLACRLNEKGVAISFVLPQKRDYQISGFELLFADILSGKNSLFPVYTNFSLLGQELEFGVFDLLGQVLAYAQRITEVVKKEKFDLIHAHDWLSFPAGIKAAEISGKPLVVHVHITEFDKTGGASVDERVFAIEKKGMERADKVIAVSGMTKSRLVDLYQIKPEKIEVVHNGVDAGEWQGDCPLPSIKTTGKKIVLFLGRLTLQKGPDWFMRAAEEVLKIDPQVLFVFTGDGEMMPQLVQQAAEMGISENVLFTGFLRDKERLWVYKAADLYVLPSVSDPFGITALEAMAAGVPVLISRQVGAGEALDHVLKVDFWDTREMAAKILAALKYRPLSRALKKNGLAEVKHLSWENAAEKCLSVYHQLVPSY